MLAFALANAALDLGKVGKWLMGRSVWQLLCLALLAYVIVLKFEVADARHDRDSYKGQRDRLQAELDRISTRKNEQKSVTSGNIAKAREDQKRAEDKAREVESAPLPGNCATPQEVLRADI